MVKAFYQSIHYEPLRERNVRRGPPGANIAFSGADPAARSRLLDYFEEMSMERVGILRGEYLMHYSGLLLIERDGPRTIACASLEDFAMAQHLQGEAYRPDLAQAIDALVQRWDRLPLVENLPLLCDPYAKNYFHFSLELAPRLRFFEREPMVVMTPDSLARPFQRDLATRLLGRRRVTPLHWGVRIRDPVIAYDNMSEEGVNWLREASGLSARHGGRRVYVRRSGQGTRTRAGGGLSESPAFQTLLEDYSFETVEFGNGDRDVAEQVAMLDGAGLILAAHGAALANLTYLDPSVRVIEIIGSARESACFMHLAGIVGLTYHGVSSAVYDERDDIVVDLDALRDAIRAFV